MARRIRRPSVVWLPADAENRLGVAPLRAASGALSSSGIGLFAVGGLAGSSSVFIAPVVKDEPVGTASGGITSLDTSLADLEGSAYRLRRVVGKIWVQTAQQTIINDSPIHFIVTAGLMVLRTGPTGDIITGAATDYAPATLDNLRDPWIWRRSWGISDLAQMAARNVAVPDSEVNFGWNGNNAFYGSVMDGPHVDAKTARVISDEERLFLVVGATPVPGGSGQETNGNINVIWDLRVLASMRKQAGNRRNASR